jgi:K+-transporting ATPase ATPase A chain
MTSEFVFVLAILILLLLCSAPLGQFFAKILKGHKTFLTVLTPLESIFYRICGVNPTEEMDAKAYAKALLIFNAMGLCVVLLLQILQPYIPFSSEHQNRVPFLLALNTAISFVTNTNWQAYSGETTMSYATQMLGLGVQNFLSAATGIAVMTALARGLVRREQKYLGNFWVDVMRSTLYILLPLCGLFALFLISQGVVQNFMSYIDATSLEGLAHKIPMGPAASQIAIKQLGSNGGGFFGVNSAHPFENPTGLSNFFEILAILLIPCALPFTFGALVRDKKHGRVIFATMLTMFLIGLAAALYFESQSVFSSSPLLEGKELRFGIAPSTLWTMATTFTSNGSVNSMISSASPLVGGIAMFNIMLGEVVFGGVGSGMYGIVLFIILTVFIAGLMVGRTPEYLGKKIEAAEIQLAVIGVLAPCAVILFFSGLACITSTGLSSLSSKGPHGLSEILYAFTSAAGNNGSAFAGLNANTNFYNIMTGLGMLIGRYAIIIPVLLIAGQLALKKQTPPSSGTFPTDTVLFGILLSATILIIGGLTFFPALSLGPIVEHLLFSQNRYF